MLRSDRVVQALAKIVGCRIPTIDPDLYEALDDAKSHLAGEGWDGDAAAIDALVGEYDKLVRAYIKMAERLNQCRAARKAMI